MLISTIVISAAVAMIITNTGAISGIEQGQMAYQAAESGVEEAVIQLLRNPNFSGTVSNISTGLSKFTYTVSVSSPKTIDSYGSYLGFKRHIYVTTSYNSGQLVVNPWQESF